MKKLFLALLVVFAAVDAVSRASQITLQTYGGWWVTAQGGGGQDVYANAGAPGGWETFTLNDLNGGALESGDPITIQAPSGHYFCAEGGGGQALVANRGAVGGWEIFYIYKLNGGGAIGTGDSVAIQGVNGQFVCAEGGGGGVVNVNRSAIGGWEAFTIATDASGGGGNATPQVSLNPSTYSAQAGQTISFSVSANCGSGLNEIGLEGCDTNGNAVSNLGCVGASGTSSNYTFTWTAPSAGTYYFDGYGWNVDRSQLTRTSVITVSVSAGSAAPQVTFTPSSTSVQSGEAVNFSVTANCASGLNEIGLEGCDTAGTAVVNLGALAVSGGGASHTFSWQASTPGTYYFDAYGWNADRSQLTRTTVATITVTTGGGSPSNEEGDVAVASLGLVGDVVLHSGVAPTVTVTASATSAKAGQGITFTVSANGVSGLSELGLEACDANGVPAAAVGAVGVTGESASHTFTWSTPAAPNGIGSETYAFWRSAPDTFYFVAYAWNSDCSKRTRTGVVAVNVGFEVNTTFEGWTVTGSGSLYDTQWSAWDPRTESGMLFIGALPEVPAPATFSRGDFDEVLNDLAQAEFERQQELNAAIGAEETARLEQQISEALGRGHGYKLVDQDGNVVKTVLPPSGNGWTMTTVYHIAGMPPTADDVVRLPAFVVNGNDLSTFDWNAYTAWFNQNGLQAIYPAGVTAAAAGTPADNVSSNGAVYQKSQLNAKFSIVAVYDILSKTPRGQAFAAQLKAAKIFTFTSVSKYYVDPGTGQKVYAQDSDLLGFTAGGNIYINVRLSNEKALETLFHEFQHKSGVGSTPADEAAIRTLQIQFMQDLGLRTIIPNAVIPPSSPGGQPTIDPAAVQQSIPASYQVQWYLDKEGKVYGRKVVQEPTP